MGQKGFSNTSPAKFLFVLSYVPYGDFFYPLSFQPTCCFSYSFCVFILHNCFIYFQWSFSNSAEIFLLLKGKKNPLSSVCCISLFGFINFEEMAFLNNLYIKLVCNEFLNSHHCSYLSLFKALSALSFKLASAFTENKSWIFK